MSVEQEIKSARKHLKELLSNRNGRNFRVTFYNKDKRHGGVTINIVAHNALEVFRYMRKKSFGIKNVYSIERKRKLNSATTYIVE
jgi:hypothetical protein